jgi:signal transduction histidine kinase
LIDNAVNYIDKKQGLVEVSATQDGDSYIFAVDDGVGMPKRFIQKYLKHLSLSQLSIQQV